MKTSITSIGSFIFRIMIAFVITATTAVAAEPAESAGPPTVVVPVEPVSVTVIEGNRAIGVLSVALILQVDNAVEQGLVAVQRPRLQASYRQLLSTLAARRIDIRRPINVTMLDLYLQRLTDRQLGKGRANVLIQSVTVSTS